MPNAGEKRIKRTRADAANLRKPMKSSHSAPPRYVAFLGIKTEDTGELLRKIEEGLSYKALERLQKTIHLSLKEIAEHLRIPPRTLSRRKEQGRLEPDESDRLLRLSRVFAKSLELFEGDTNAARRWLQTPQRALAGSLPLEFARTEVGAREVENLIGRLEHGIPS